MATDESVKPPLKLVKFVVKYPCLACCGTIWICILMQIILFAVVVGQYNKTKEIPITVEGNDYNLKDIRSVEYDSFILAKELVVEQREATTLGVLEEIPQPRQSESMSVCLWMYEAETDKGMFTEAGIKDMRKAEGIVFEHNEWRDWCKLEYAYGNVDVNNATCASGLSVLQIFYAESWNTTLAQSVLDRLAVPSNLALYQSMGYCLDYGLGCDTMGNATADQIAIATTLSGDIDTIMSKWNGKGANIVPDIEQAVLFCAYMKLLPTRAFRVDYYFDSKFNVDNPISMHSRAMTLFGGPLKEYTRIDQAPETQIKMLTDFVLGELYGDMEKVADVSFSDASNIYYLMPQLLESVILAILFRDVLLAILSVVMVFLYLWFMLGSGFLACVGMLEILFSIPCAWFLFKLIFRIEYFAATNVLTIFIICAIGADDIFVFMDAYKQSAYKGPEINKDLATRMSWVWRKSGTAMTITSATTCMAFLSTCFTPLASTRSFGIFASLVVLWDFVLVMSMFCTATIVYHNRFEREPLCHCILCGCCTKGCDCTNQRPSPTEKIASEYKAGTRETGGVKDRITLFFGNQVASFVLNPKARIGLLVFFLALLIPNLFYVTKLEPTKEAEQFLPADHPLQKSITILDEFPASSEDRGLEVYFTWGLGEVDRKGVHQLLNSTNVGKPTFKKDFSLTPKCQSKMLEVCENLEFTNSAERLRLIKRAPNGFGVVKCVMPSLLQDATARGWATNHTDLGGRYFIPTANVAKAMKNFTDDPPAVENVETLIDHLGFDGTSLKFISVVVECQTMDEHGTLPEDDTRANYDGFKAIVEELDAIVGDACGATGVSMTDPHQKFVFMNNQKIYRTSAVSGACIGVALAFCVILFATRSLLLSAFSTLSILCTIMSVIGTVTMLGWTLGTIESILISILAGFSVDYVVHLAHAYSGSRGTNEERIRSAFGEMGTPVLSGMITSVLASVPLFLCQVVFFAKFGTFLCFTILWSWIFANFFFMSLLATFGKANSPNKVVPISSEEARGEEESEKS